MVNQEDDESTYNPLKVDKPSGYNKANKCIYIILL